MRGPREKLSGQPFFAARTMLQVDEQPVESAEGTDFGRARRAEIEKRPPRNIAAADTTTQRRHDALTSE